MSGAGRGNPKALTDLIEWTDARLADLFRSLDPHGPAIFPVAWAGVERSENWMDVARDYTEKWHHTQQIFDATKRPSTIPVRRLGYPCLDIFMRALPFTFRTVDAAVGSVVTGEVGGHGHVERREAGWEQTAESPRSPAATVFMAQDTARKLVTKRRSPEAVLQQFPAIRVTGDAARGRHVLEMVSVMA
jgi:hypothetical protein